MSKQLTLSIAASLLAMGGFVMLTATFHAQAPTRGLNQTGATIETAAPAFDRVLSAPVDLVR